MSQSSQEEENRREYNRQENQREEINRNNFYSEENQIEAERLKKENEIRSKKYLDDGNLLGYSVENNLPLKESSSQERNISDSNLSEEDTLSKDVSENSAYDNYLSLINYVNLLKEHLFNEIRRTMYAKYTPPEYLDPLMKRIDSIIYTDTESMKEVDLLELKSKNAVWLYPNLQSNFEDFFSACRILIMSKGNHESLNQKDALLLKEDKSRKDPSLYDSYLSRITEQKKVVDSSYVQLRDRIFSILALEEHPPELKNTLKELAYLIIIKHYGSYEEMTRRNWKGMDFFNRYPDLSTRLKIFYDNYMDSNNMLNRIESRFEFLKTKNNW